MTDSVIQELTAQLDSAIPREGAAVRLSAVIEHPWEEASQFTVIANRADTFGSALRACRRRSHLTAANDRELSYAILTDAGDLFFEATPVRFERIEQPPAVTTPVTVKFERTEHPPVHRVADVPTDPPRVVTALLTGLVIAVLLLAIVCFLAGVVTVIGWAIAALAS